MVYDEMLVTRPWKVSFVGPGVRWEIGWVG